MEWHIQRAKGEKKKKNTQPRIPHLARLFFKNEKQIKTYPDKQKVREFFTSRNSLEEIIKRVLQAEIKCH